jgi:hypothetical protein
MVFPANASPKHTRIVIFISGNVDFISNYSENIEKSLHINKEKINQEKITIFNIHASNFI